MIMMTFFTGIAITALIFDLLLFKSFKVTVYFNSIIGWMKVTNEFTGIVEFIKYLNQHKGKIKFLKV